MKGKNWIFSLVIATAVIALMVPAAGFAADQLRVKEQLKLQDGSCQDDVQATSTSKAVSDNDNGDKIQDKIQDQTRDPLKLKDGSCQLD